MVYIDNIIMHSYCTYTCIRIHFSYLLYIQYSHNTCMGIYSITFQVYIISFQDAARLRSTIQDIITDRTSRVAYAYVNSDSVILYHVARRALTNLKVYGTTLPTVCQKCARQRRIYDQCVTNMRSCKATKLLSEIEECADWSETCIRRGCGEPPLCDFCD